MATISNFSIELVTPMFMGGAEPQRQPEFRVASLKGLLRFWFRAIYPNEADTERQLFGAMDYRSPLQIRVKADKLSIGQIKSHDLQNYSYLGYGLLNYDPRSRRFLTGRPYYKPGSRFTVTFAFSPLLGQNDREKILRAFWALAMLGGLGTRNRRGFGAFYVTSGPPPTGLTFNPAHTEGLIEALQTFFRDVVKVTGVPEYSCFSDKSVVLAGASLSDGLRVLEGFNAVFHRQRSYYQIFPSTPRTSGIPKNDHDLMLRFLTVSTFIPPAAPARAVYGLPHNYYFRSSGQKGFVDLMEGGVKGRRASPLFLHVQKLADNRACGVITFLPARFLPPGRRITLSAESGRSVPVNPPNYQAIVDFLNELIRKGARKVL